MGLTGSYGLSIRRVGAGGDLGSSSSLFRLDRDYNLLFSEVVDVPDPAKKERKGSISYVGRERRAREVGSGQSK